jgi:hypothetical protein
MLILDTPAQERWTRTGALERTQAQRQAALEQEIFSNTVSVCDDAGYDTSELLAQMGHFLSPVEVQRRLHLCNPKLIFEQAIRHPELTGVYFEKDERSAAGGWDKRKIFICGMPTSDIMPEFSILHQTMKRVPNPEVIAGGGTAVAREAVKWIEVPTFYAETRGWRTVLIRLLHLGLITRFEVEQHFTWNPTRDSAKWAAGTR